MDNTEQGESLTLEYRKTRLNIPGLLDEYTIDNLGVVFNITKGYALKGTSVTKNNRYVKIHLDKFYPLHRLVAEHFISNPMNLPQVNHKNGNRLINGEHNLEWSTSSSNVKHAYDTGLKTNSGEKNPISVLTEQEVSQIWALRHAPLTARQIRDKLNLSVGIDAVKSVRQGKNWSHLTSTLI